MSDLDGLHALQETQDVLGGLVEFLTRVGDASSEGTKAELDELAGKLAGVAAEIPKVSKKGRAASRTSFAK